MSIQTTWPPRPARKAYHNCARGCLKMPDTVEYAIKRKAKHLPPPPPEPPKARVIKHGESLPLQILMCFLLGAIFGGFFAIALLSCLPV